MTVLDQVPHLAWLLIDALAIARITRLLTRDSWPPAVRARERVLDRWGSSPWSELVVCPWCMSVYVAAAVMACRLLIPTPWSPLSLLLALALVGGALAARE